MYSAWTYTLIPAAAVIVGAGVALARKPSPVVTSALQHLAAGVLFAAIAGELLPDLKHRSPFAVIIGGGLGIVAMMLVKVVGERVQGPRALIAMLGIDLLVDGLVLGIGFVAGAAQGLLLTVALTLEVLFLGLAVVGKLTEELRSRRKTLLAIAGLALLMPVGALLGGPVSSLPETYVAGFFAFALVALLYLVTEELLVEAHEVPHGPWTAALFFVGFLAMLLLEQAVSGGTT